MSYSSVFQPLIKPPPPHPATDLKIDLHPGSYPKQAPPFSFTDEEQRWLAQFLDELSIRSWVEDSTSDWASPALLVRKPKRGYRLVIDYSHLNSCTKQDKYPLPRISDILRQSKGSSWFSTLAIQHGFHQTFLHPQYRHLTAFSTPFGLYQWTVCPQGVTNGPSSFSRRIRHALRDLMAQPQKFCAAYIDDILIHSQSFEQHLDHLCAVLHALQRNHLHVSLHKSVLFRTGVTYLGHFLSDKGVSPDPSKLAALKDYPQPETLAQLWKFVGAVNWFRTFIPHLSTYAHPLQQCIRNSTKDHLAWTDQCTESFIKVKEVLCELTEQTVFDPNRVTCLWTDASDVGLGSVLMQQDPSTKQWHPVHFFSRSLQGPESRYDVRDKELRSVFASIKSMHHLLRGVPFQLLTDHRSLQHLRSTKLHTSQRHIRWLEYLQQFNYEPAYIPGESNCVADLLSRRPTWFKHFEPSLKKWSDRWSDRGIQTGSVVHFIHVSSHISYESSESCLHILNTTLAQSSSSISSLSGLPLSVPSLPQSSPTITCLPAVADLLPSDLLNSVLRSQQQHISPDITLSTLHMSPAGQILIPKQDDVLARRIVAELHSSFHHLGRTKTSVRVKRLFWVYRLHAVCAAVCKSCQVCQQIKTPRQPPYGTCKPLNSQDSASSPMHTVNLDFVWGLPSVHGLTGFLTIVDGFSKHVTAYPLKTSCTSQVVARCLKEWSALFGMPFRIRSDQDPRFTSHVLQEVLKHSGISVSMSSGYHPVANGIVERVQQTLVQMLRASILSSNSSWPELLPLCCFALNSVPHSSTGHSPNRLMFGRDLPDLPILASDSFSPEAYRVVKDQARESLLAAREQVKQRSARTVWTVSPGDKVWLSTKHLSLASGVGLKLMPKYFGPFPVLSSTLNTATLQLPPNLRCRSTWHLSFLKPFVPDQWFSSGSSADFGFSWDDVVELPDLPPVVPHQPSPQQPEQPVQPQTQQPNQLQPAQPSLYVPPHRRSDRLAALQPLGQQSAARKATRQPSQPSPPVDDHLDLFEDDNVILISTFHVAHS